MKKLTRLYLKEIVCRHGVHVLIILDRDIHFTSRFWRSLQEALGTNLDMSIAYHPQTDGQSEMTIQTLKDMLCAYVIDREVVEISICHWSSSHITIVITEALRLPHMKLYIKGSVDCLYARVWLRIANSSVLIRDTTSKIIQIKNRLLATCSRQKSYADKRAKPLEFEVGDMVLRKILARVSHVSCMLEFPEELKGIHSTFHVLNLKKCSTEGDVVIPLDEIQLDDKLNMIEEPVEVFDKEVKRLRQSRIPIVKVHWNSQRGPESTWECKDQIRKSTLISLQVRKKQGKQTSRAKHQDDAL
nr:hypothetical protein [Tanacetum cinerariifolium]